MTTINNIMHEQIFNRLIAQLPPWFNNPQFIPINFDEQVPSTNFNNITWAFLVTAFNSYYQFQYDWLQMRIGAYEIMKDPNWNINSNISSQYPFVADTVPTEYSLLNPPLLYPIAFENCLDAIANDFFGDNLTRRPDETDNNFRNRILANVMKPKATRQAMLNALIALVTPAFEQAGIPLVPPQIYEGWYPFDNGGYNDFQALAFGTPGGNPPPNGVGAYGTGDAYVASITVFLPLENKLAGYPGFLTQGESINWGAGFGDPSITESTPSIDIPPNWYGSDTLLDYLIEASDVQNVINLTKVLGTQVTFTIIYVT